MQLKNLSLEFWFRRIKILKKKKKNIYWTIKSEKGLEGKFLFEKQKCKLSQNHHKVVRKYQVPVRIYYMVFNDMYI